MNDKGITKSLDIWWGHYDE